MNVRLAVHRLAFLFLGAALLAGCGDSAPKEAATPEPAGGTSSADAAVPGTPGLPGASAPTAVDPALEIPRETVVVVVDGEAITQGDVDDQLLMMVYGGMKVNAKLLADARRRHGPMAQKELVTRKLLQHAAEAEGLEATPEEIAEQWKPIEARMPKGMDKKAFLESKGFSMDEADKQIRLGVLVRKLMEKHAQPEPVTDEAVRAYYDENAKQFETPARVHARHILLPVGAGATEEDKAAAKARIEGFRAEIAEKGKDHFQVLAEQHSSCPSKAKGGSLGFFGRGQMVPEFDKVAFDLEPGVVSEPVLTQFGWHILLVEEKQEAGTRPFDEVKASLKRHLEQTARHKAQSDYIDTLRDAATIEHPADTKK